MAWLGHFLPPGALGRKGKCTVVRLACYDVLCHCVLSIVSPRESSLYCLHYTMMNSSLSVSSSSATLKTGSRITTSELLKSSGLAPMFGTHFLVKFS